MIITGPEVLTLLAQGKKLRCINPVNRLRNGQNKFHYVCKGYYQLNNEQRLVYMGDYNDPDPMVSYVSLNHLIDSEFEIAVRPTFSLAEARAYLKTGRKVRNIQWPAYEYCYYDSHNLCVKSDTGQIIRMGAENYTSFEWELVE